MEGRQPSGIDQLANPGVLDHLGEAELHPVGAEWRGRGGQEELRLDPPKHAGGGFAGGVMPLVQNQYVNILRGSLVKQAEVSYAIKANQPLIVLIGLDQQVSSHGCPAGCPAVLFIQTLCDHVGHDGLAAACRTFQEDRPMALGDGAHGLVDDTDLVVSWL
jgi:hypothetical protein